MKKVLAILALTVAGLSISSQVFAAKQCRTVKNCWVILGVEVICYTSEVCDELT